MLTHHWYHMLGPPAPFLSLPLTLPNGIPFPPERPEPNITELSGDTTLNHGGVRPKSGETAGATGTPVPTSSAHGCGVCNVCEPAASSSDGRLMTSSAGDPTEGRPVQRAGMIMEVRTEDKEGALEKYQIRAIRCTTPNCTCDCFVPGKNSLRACDTCHHGWVFHALDKLGFHHLFNCHQVEAVQASIAFDIASLMLYGTQAIPIRLKILLDRLFSVLQHEEVLQVLHCFGWSYEDYARGYIIQDAAGNVLDRWMLVTHDEELVILQQFLRFGETKAIAQHLLLHESSDRNELVVQQNRSESDIKKFIERTNRVVSTNFVKQTHLFNNTSSGNPGLVATSKGPPLPQQPPNDLVKRAPTPPVSPPPNSCASPLTVSPLNKLQNMQPFDYRRERTSPEARVSDASVLTLAQSTPLSSPTTSLPSGSTFSNSLVNHSSMLNLNSDLSATDGGSDDDTNGAMNLSQSAGGGGALGLVSKKVKHLRKSMNPMKRRWNPMVLSTLTTNPSTGKKRVQCHVCLKTFCDKGALKIHFSAVHLREMHKCTVEGCNMMFSSRRSRNRHSANPNPKLHTPNLRRKINPHDGRTANPYPVLPPTTLMNYNNNIVPPPLGSFFGAERLSLGENHKGIGMPVTSGDDSASSPSLSTPMRSSSEEMGALALTKKLRLEDGDNEMDEASNGVEEGINLSLKDEASKGVRKRKSMNPTRCQVTSDDDLQYVSTDDSSSDTYLDQGDDENGLLESKSDECTSELGGDDSKDDDLDKDDSDYNQGSKEKRLEGLKRSSSPVPPVPEAKEPLPPPKENVTIDLSKREAKEENIEPEPVSENPLRHLESLSLGTFSGLVSPPTRSIMGPLPPTTSAISFHAPGFGLGEPPQSESVRDPSKSSADTSPVVASSSIPMTSPTDQDGSLSDQQMSLLPVFRDASIVGAVEIPVDKENPRRCTACGKIFQNHFGVKTHYQNVHLKLMHKCTVEGCNAAFPSKRSRDRHSANLNLHRKLLSTHTDKSSSFLDKNTLYPYHPSANIRDEFLSRLYDPLALSDLYHGRIPPCGPEGLLGNPAFANHLNTALGAVSGFHPAFMVSPPTTGPLSEGVLLRGISGRETPTSSLATTPSPQPSTPTSKSNSFAPVTLEANLNPDEEGKYLCLFCSKKFQENVVLREHYEKYHTQELLKCTAEGCDKVFLSRKTRNLHEELHKKDKQSVSS